MRDIGYVQLGVQECLRGIEAKGKILIKCFEFE